MNNQINQYEIEAREERKKKHLDLINNARTTVSLHTFIEELLAKNVNPPVRLMNFTS